MKTIKTENTWQHIYVYQGKRNSSIIEKSPLGKIVTANINFEINILFKNWFFCTGALLYLQAKQGGKRERRLHN